MARFALLVAALAPASALHLRGVPQDDRKGPNGSIWLPELGRPATLAQPALPPQQIMAQVMQRLQQANGGQGPANGSTFEVQQTTDANGRTQVSVRVMPPAAPAQPTLALFAGDGSPEFPADTRVTVRRDRLTGAYASYAGRVFTVAAAQPNPQRTALERGSFPRGVLEPVKMCAEWNTTVQCPAPKTFKDLVAKPLRRSNFEEKCCEVSMKEGDEPSAKTLPKPPTRQSKQNGDAQGNPGSQGGCCSIQ